MCGWTARKAANEATRSMGLLAGGDPRQNAVAQLKPPRRTPSRPGAERDPRQNAVAQLKQTSLGTKVMDHESRVPSCVLFKEGTCVYVKFDSLLESERIAQERGWWTTEDLARECGVALPTAAQWIQALTDDDRQTHSRRWRHHAYRI